MMLGNMMLLRTIDSIGSTIQKDLSLTEEEPININSFDDELYIAFFTMPLFPIQKMCSEEVQAKLNEYKQNYKNYKHYDSRS